MTVICVLAEADVAGYIEFRKGRFEELDGGDDWACWIVC